jgi:hypothetical protein
MFTSFSVIFQNSKLDQGVQIQMDSTNIKELKKTETYIQASVDKNGQLCIITGDGRKIIMQKDTDQVGFEHIHISADRHSVGWLANYPNSSTSYPIPLVLIIYANGTLHEFKGNELPIWKWHFNSDSKLVAYEQETVHGSLGIHYELHEIASERMIDSYEPEYGPDNRVLKIRQNPPKWVEELNEVDIK